MFELDEDTKQKIISGILGNSPQLGGPAMTEIGGTPGENLQESIRQQQQQQYEQQDRNSKGFGQSLTEDLVGSLAAGPGIGQLAGLIADPVKDAEALIGGAATVKGLGAAYDATKAISKGEGRDEIFQRLGIYQGPGDKELRAIISDEKAALAGSILGAKNLGEALQHSELFKSYPELKDIPFSIGDTPAGSRATFNEGGKGIVLNKDLDPSEQLDVLLHEVQHAIQKREGFITGSSPAAMRRDPRFLQGMSDPQTMQELLATKQSQGLRQSLSDILAEKLYRLVGGEAEARAVQTQLKNKDWTSIPTSLYDVPYQAVIKPR